MMAQRHVAALLVGLLVPTFALAQSEQAVELYARGVANNEIGLLVEASILLTEAIAVDHEYAEAYYQRGLSFEGMGKRRAAIKDYTAAIGYKIPNLNPYFKLIVWHKSQHQYLAALVVTDQIIANFPENTAGGYYDKGQIYELMNEPALAIAAYQASIDHLDDDNSDFMDVLIQRISNLRN